MPTQKGGASASYTFGSSAVAPGAPYATEVIAKPACLSAQPPGALTAYTPPNQGGLPGLGGGGRRRRKRTKRSGSKRSGSKRSRGGKKRRGLRTRRARGGGWSMSGAPLDGPNVLTDVVPTGCRGAHYQQGRAPGGSASPFYTAQTAGYGFAPSSWQGASGSPVNIQVPYNPNGLNQACLKTGGGKRKRGTRRRR